MKKPIGGYFSLELPILEEFHQEAIKLNTGRNSLEYILLSRKYRKVYIPYFTCEVILEPFKKTATSYEFYHINLDLELLNDVKLCDDEALLYTNYFGLKMRYAKELAQKYGEKLILDNTQGFYSKPIKGIDTFYSCRKFFGVPDGAYLYVDKKINMDLEKDVSFDRMDFLIKRIDIGAEGGYQDFQEISNRLVGRSILMMSNLTQRMMQSIDYSYVAMKRRNNFMLLDKFLNDSNILNIQLDEDAVPMVYPYMTDKKNIRQHLIKNKVFVAKYWPNVDQWVSNESIEYRLANTMLSLPIDQRYGEEELTYIINKIKEVP